jgi:membrane-associated phospholipid phosphatase
MEFVGGIRKLLTGVRSKPAVTAALLAGGAAAAASMWAFARIADLVTDHARIVNLDAAIAKFAETHNTEWGEMMFLAFTQLGSSLLIAIVAITVATLFFRRHRQQALALAVTGSAGWTLNVILKHLFHRGRPESASEFIHVVSWSFPSGHAMNATICYGFMAVLLLERETSPARRRLILGATSALVFLIGFSRVYLTVHYVSDVIAGFLAGVVWLATCTLLYLAGRYRTHSAASP